jgi:hypothetical protein
MRGAVLLFPPYVFMALSLTEYRQLYRLIRKYCDSEDTDFGILTDFHVLSTTPPPPERLVSLYVRMDVALAGARTVERILFMFGIHELVRYKSTPGEYSASKVKNA